MIQYARHSGETLVQTARIRLLGIGKYAFETSLFGEKPFELNMNMPMFDTEAQAHEWIKDTGKWRLSTDQHLDGEKEKATKNLFNMSFDELSRDFNARIGNGPPIRIGTKPFLSLEYERGDMSTNDVLKRWLISNGLPYINTFNGDVWFSRDGVTWESSVRECAGELIHFYIAR